MTIPIRISNIMDDNIQSVEVNPSGPYRLLINSLFPPNPDCDDSFGGIVGNKTIYSIFTIGLLF